jgi:hypothetical protein
MEEESICKDVPGKFYPSQPYPWTLQSSPYTISIKAQRSPGAQGARHRRGATELGQQVAPGGVRAHLGMIEGGFEVREDSAKFQRRSTGGASASAENSARSGTV